MFQHEASYETQGHGYFPAGKFLVLVILLAPFFTQAYVSPGRPTGLVNDFANVIPSSARISIESKLQSLQQSTGIQVAVTTVPSLGDETIDSYAVALFQDWGIGIKGKDNGLLILVAPNDRQARIEVGYGLEGTVTDLQAGNIVNDVMLPAFKTGDYAGGISDAVDALSGIIAKDPTIIAAYSGPSSQSAAQTGDWQKNIFAFFFLGVIILNALARTLGRTKSWWLGGVIGAVIGLIIGFIWGFIYVGIGWIIALTILGLIFDYFVSKHPPGPGGRGGGFWPIIFFGGGRGGFGGGGGGGFGGFGGGMSGGGGASGRW